MLSPLHFCVLAFLCILPAIAVPVPSAYYASLGEVRTHQNILRNAPRSISTPQSMSHRVPSQPACNDIPSRLLQKPHSLFINAKTIDCALRSGSVHTLGHGKSPSAFPMLRSLSRAERVLAPVIILFTMVWIAALAVGTVEGVSRAWKRWYYTGGYEVVDDDVLEEVVISLGHVEDDWEDQELMCVDATEKDSH